MKEMSAKTRNAALLRLLGKNVAWRVDDSALTGSDREQAIEEHRLARDKRDTARRQRDARAAELLKNDPTYQALVAEAKEAEAFQVDLQRKGHRRRITVGTNAHPFFLVEVEADSWDEAITKLEAKYGAKKGAA